MPVRLFPSLIARVRMCSPGPIARTLLLALLVVGTALSAGPVRADVGDALRAIQRDGHARILMRMRAAEGGWVATDSASRQARAVEAAVAATQPVLDAARVRDYRRFQTLPYLAAVVDREQLLSLAGSSAVESIQMVTVERKLVDYETQKLASSVPSIDVPAAWAQGYDGTGYVVAVIDGGFNLSHPMLSAKVVAEGCFRASSLTTTTNRCPSGITPSFGAGAASNCPIGSDRCDHGTHVASIAVGNDGTNFGVARGAKLMALDVFSTSTDPNDCDVGETSCEVTDSLTVFDALDYVNAHSAEFNIAAVNISIGGRPVDGYCDDDARKSLIDMLRAKGIAVAIAAGNDGVSGQIERPACISSAEAVGATDDATAVASFSNFSTLVDFMAPGVGVFAAAGSGSGLISRQGTSMAAPHVAGAWAIMRQAFPAAAFDQIETALKQTGLSVTRTGTTYTVPKIQVGAAIAKLKGKDRGIVNGVASSANTAVGQSFLRLYNKSAKAGTVTVSLRDGPTGALVATWTSPEIQAGASPQYPLSTIERDAVPASGGSLQLLGRTYYNVDVTSTFAGYLQHVQWKSDVSAFNNVTSCGTGVVNDASVISNVHTSKIDAYVSRIRIVNTGAFVDRAVLTIANEETGAAIGQWTSPEIATGAALEVSSPQLEAQVSALQDAVASGLRQYNVSMSRLGGYMQHVIENQGAGVLVDMSGKCALTVVAAPAVSPAK